jgi:uncharacterized membrane protein YphA (DoxX/SURF4 family)
MQHSTTSSPHLRTGERRSTRSAADQGYHVLHAAFVVAPVVAGLDKFTHLLTDWDQYLAPQIARMSPIGGHGLMLVVGVVEIMAGLLVALKPKIGGIVVSLWLLGIVGSLLMQGRWFDIALRDFGLALGAFALARIAAGKERGEIVAREAR